MRSRGAERLAPGLDGSHRGHRARRSGGRPRPVPGHRRRGRARRGRPDRRPGADRLGRDRRGRAWSCRARRPRLHRRPDAADVDRGCEPPAPGRPGRQARTTLAQRLGLDLALVAVAGVALWQLRLYGAPLTRNAQGPLGLDPLLVAAPAIGLVGGSSRAPGRPASPSSANGSSSVAAASSAPSAGVSWPAPAALHAGGALRCSLPRSDAGRRPRCDVDPLAVRPGGVPGRRRRPGLRAATTRRCRPGRRTALSGDRGGHGQRR